MNYGEWLEQTSAGALKRRSGMLTAVDNAFSRYDTCPSKSTLAAIEKALNSWKSWKGNWQNSCRNARGAIVKLDQFIAQQKIPTAPGLPKQKPASVKPKGAVGNPFQQAATVAALKLKSQQDQEYAVNIVGSQTITYPIGSWRNVQVQNNGVWQWELQQATAPTAIDYPLNVSFGLIKRGTVIECIVRAKLKPKTGVVITDAMKIAFKTHIQSAFNIATIYDKGAQYDLLFTLEWVENGAGYEINIANPPPIPANISRDKVAELKKANTINVGEWAWSDRQAIIHEFGHMIGCPDEYTVTAISDNLGFNFSQDIFNRTAFTTDSLMNDTTKKGRIHERHFSCVRHAYNQWQKSLGRANVNALVKIVRPSGIQTATRKAMEERRRMMGYDD